MVKVANGMIGNPSEADKAEVIQSTLEVIYSITFPLQVWEPLLNSKKNLPTELKIRALPIIYCCLFDIAKAPRDHMVKHIIRSENWGGFLNHNLKTLARECRFASFALRDLSLEDQIFLRLTRNRMVHGFLSGRTKAKHKIPFITKQGFDKVWVTSKEASESLGAYSKTGTELLNKKRLEEMVDRFDAPFQKYLSQTEEHCFVDTERLRRALLDDHPIFMS